MEDRIKETRRSFEEDIKNASDTGSLEGIRIKYLGRKGILSDLLSALPSLDQNAKPKIGKELNILKTYIQKEIQNKKENISLDGKAKKVALDITLEGTEPKEGRLHPITKTLNLSLIHI